MILDSIVFLVFIVFFWERIKAEIKELLSWSAGFKSCQVDQQGSRFFTKYEKNHKKQEKNRSNLVYYYSQGFIFLYLGFYILFKKNFY
jgi:dolichol kinase